MTKNKDGYATGRWLKGIYDLRLMGNVIPHTQYQRVGFENRKPMKTHALDSFNTDYRAITSIIREQSLLLCFGLNGEREVNRRVGIKNPPSKDRGKNKSVFLHTYPTDESLPFARFNSKQSVTVSSWKNHKQSSHVSGTGSPTLPSYASSLQPVPSRAQSSCAPESNKKKNRAVFTHSDPSSFLFKTFGDFR